MKNEKSAIELAGPEITTYDRDELTLQTGFTAPISELTTDSDRKIKGAVRPVRVRRVILGLMSATA